MRENLRDHKLRHILVLHVYKHSKLRIIDCKNRKAPMKTNVFLVFRRIRLFFSHQFHAPASDTWIVLLLMEWDSELGAELEL